MSVIDKIRKLMKHRDSAAAIGSEHEAAAFAEKIQQLMTEHEIEISQIKMDERDSAYDDKVDKEYFVYWKHDIPIRRKMQWQHTLATSVARAHFCEILIPNSKSENWLFFVGKQANRTVAIYMFTVLCRTALNLAQIEYLKAWKIEQREGDVTRLRGFKQSFLSSFVDRVAFRYLKAAVEARVKSETTALILRNVENDVKLFMSSFSPAENSANEGDVWNEVGRRAGRNVGDKVSLAANAVNQSNRKEKLL
jgi:hypothetical protein